MIIFFWGGKQVFFILFYLQIVQFISEIEFLLKVLHSSAFRSISFKKLDKLSKKTFYLILSVSVFFLNNVSRNDIPKKFKEFKKDAHKIIVFASY